MKYSGYDTGDMCGTMFTEPGVVQVHVEWQEATQETFIITLSVPSCPPLCFMYHANKNKVVVAVDRVLEPRVRKQWLLDGIPNGSLFIALVQEQVNAM